MGEIIKSAELAISFGILGSIRVTPKTKVIRYGDMEGYSNVWSIDAPSPSNRTFFFSAKGKSTIDEWQRKIRYMDSFEQRMKEVCVW